MQLSCLVVCRQLSASSRTFKIFMALPKAAIEDVTLARSFRLAADSGARASAVKACLNSHDGTHQRPKVMTAPGEPKRAFQPLLPPGRHHMTVETLEALTVRPFPASVARPAIFAEYRRLVGDLISINLQCELWTDGSFLTEKCVPEVDDMDLSVRVTVEQMAAQSLPIQQQLTGRLNGGKRYSEVLDTYLSIIFPPGDPRQAATNDDYWAEKWLMGWDGRLKGFAVVTLGQPDLWRTFHAR